MKKYWLIGLYALALTSCDSFLNCEPENSFFSRLLKGYINTDCITAQNRIAISVSISIGSRTEICITGTDTFGVIHFSMLVQRCPCQQVLTGKVNLQILQVQFIAKLLIKSIIYLKILQTDISYIL